MPEPCTFCRIASGELEAFLVFENDLSLAFLDSRPLFPGHCLLIPRAHHETFQQLPPPLIEPLFATAQRLSRAVEQAMEAQGVFVAMNNRVSQSVPHLHIHIVPRRKKDGLRGFFWPRQKYESTQAAVAAQQAIGRAMQQTA